MGLAKTTRLIQLEEGRKLTAYKDSRGIWTIGDGYNLEAHGYSAEECEGLVWTAEQADAALADEIQAVLAELDRRWPKWRDLDEVRQAAIVSSVYQLGAPGASKFFATIHAIQSRDWETAATQMLASRWAKQTPARVKRNAEMIRTGRWPEEVNGVKFLPKPTPDSVVAPAPAESPAPVLPTTPAHVPAESQTVGGTVGAPVPTAGTLMVGGIVLSKKLCALAGGVLVLVFGPAFGLHLSPEQQDALTKALCTYLAAQGAADLGKPIVGWLKRYSESNNA